MSDKDLVKLAAKAAGLEGDFQQLRSGVRDASGLRKDIREVFVTKGLTWDPLHDDGDALRLAVKLRFEIQCYPGMGGVIYDDGSPEGGYVQQNPEAKQSDSEAVRRAIVKAAAKIGESLS